MHRQQGRNRDVGDAERDAAETCRYSCHALPGLLLTANIIGSFATLILAGRSQDAHTVRALHVFSDAPPQ